MKIVWKQVLISLLIGILAGAAIGFWATTKHLCAYRGDKKYDRMLDYFSRKLDLNESQKDKVRSILQEKRKRIKKLRAEMRPKWKKLRESTKDEIRAVISPEQRAKFEQLQEEMKSHRKRWGRRHKH